MRDSATVIEVVCARTPLSSNSGRTKKKKKKERRGGRTQSSPEQNQRWGTVADGSGKSDIEENPNDSLSTTKSSTMSLGTNKYKIKSIKKRPLPTSHDWLRLRQETALVGKMCVLPAPPFPLQRCDQQQCAVAFFLDGTLEGRPVLTSTALSTERERLLLLPAGCN